MTTKPNGVILVDGVCVLCNKFVAHVIKYDSAQKYTFGALQDYCDGDRSIPDSVVLFEAGRIYSKSTAVLRIMGSLDGPSRYLAWALIIPEFVRDSIYVSIAAARYRTFGKEISCSIQAGEHHDRLLENNPKERTRFAKALSTLRSDRFLFC